MNPLPRSPTSVHQSYPAQLPQTYLTAPPPRSHNINNAHSFLQRYFRLGLRQHHASRRDHRLPQSKLFGLVYSTLTWLTNRLISSSIFGGAIFYATTQLPHVEAARWMLTIGGLLTAFFTLRFFRSFRIVPAGVMAALRLSAFDGD